MTALVRALTALILGVLLVLTGVAGPVGRFAAAHAATAAGSLTLHAAAAEGDTPGRPLAGRFFVVNRVLGVDPTSPEQLAALVERDPHLLAGEASLGPDLTAVTDASGVARLDGLADGVYLVREQPTREGDVAWSVTTPFLVSVPMGVDAERDVVVHTKTEPLDVTLTIDEDLVAAGDTVTLRASGSVPAPDARGNLHRYALAFALDPDLRDGAVTRLWIQGADGPVALREGADYTVRFDAATGTVVAELTPAGLATLAAMRAADPTVRVYAEMTATVAGDPDRQLSSTVYLFTDGWVLPADAAALAAAAGATSVTTVAVAPPPGTPPSPAPTPTADGTAAPPAPGPTAAAPPAPPAPGPAFLARTGIELTTLLAAAGLALVTGGGLLLLRHRRDARTAPAGSAPGHEHDHHDDPPEETA